MAIDWKSAATAALPRMIELRRELHQVPEAGLDLPRTSGIVEAELSSLGLEVHRVGSGMWADLGSRGPLIAMRADMDALPVQEKTGVAYASTLPGFMHACGHDGHTAALLGAARILAAEAEAGRLGFRARLLFQAGEEGFFGARDLIAAGALEGVAAIVGGHLGDLTDELGPGQVGFMPGPMMAAADTFQGRFLGSGGHGSAPSRVPDPVSALAEYVLALASLRARELDQVRPSVISVCSIHAGTTHNVIPETSSFTGTARCLHTDIRATLERRIREVGQSVAGMRGLGFEFEWIAGYPAVVNDLRSTTLASQAASDLLGGRRVVAIQRPIMGSEDFSYYLEEVPGCFWFMNSQAPSRGIAFPNHNPRFDLDESLLSDFAVVNLAAADALAAGLR